MLAGRPCLSPLKSYQALRFKTPRTSYKSLVGLLLSVSALLAAPDYVEAADTNLAGQLRDNYRIIVEPGPAWDEADLRAIRDGAAAMPGALFDALERPLRLEKRPETCLFAQGRYDKKCPSFSKNGRVFYVYEPGAESPKLVARTMAGLSQAEQRALFLQRALVHALFAQLDKKFEWSADPRWKKINGWEGGEPLNQDWRGYNRPLGRRSAHLNLLTFAEEYFARAEVFRPQMDPNARIACRMMTASRVFTKFVQTLAPDWRPPTSECPAFEEWFDRENITGIELVFVGARADAVESIYGHIIIRATYGNGAPYFRAGEQPVFQFGAVTPSHVSSAEYIFKGLFGGFSSVLEYNSWRVADRLFARYEGRTLQRYPMNLSAEQIQQVMQRIWESQRQVHYIYYFFHQNCASLLVDLLEPALDLPFASLPSFIVMPTDVLDTLANTPNGQGKALIDSNHSLWPSSEARALDAIQRRRQIVDTLAKSGVATSDNTAWARLIADLQRLHPQVEDKDPTRRREAYAGLVAQAERALNPDARAEQIDAHHQLIRYFHLSTIVERYFVETARFLRRESMLVAGEPRPEIGARQALEDIQSIYELPTLEARMLARNEASLKQIRLLAPPTREVSTPRANRSWSAEQQAQATYDITLKGLSNAITAADGTWNGTQYIEGIEAEKRRDEDAFNRKSIGPSGRFLLGPRLALQSAEPFSGLGAAHTRVGLSAAFIRDELGEARLRGYSPEIESKIFDLNLELEPGTGWAQTLTAQAHIFRYLNLARKQGPFVESWTDHFGWGVDLQINHDGRRGLLLGGDASTGYLYPFWMSERGVNHLVLGVFGALRGDFGEVRSRSMIGAQVFLRAQAHLYGSFANLLQLKLQTHQFISLDNTWQFDASGELNTRHALGSVEQYPLWLEPYVALEYTSRVYKADAQPVGDLTAGTRLELSFQG